MIFVTIGTQEPFDRLLKVMDEIAANTKEKIVVQALGGNYQVKHMELKGFLNPKDFLTLFEEARIIVSHAGMGTIISALTMNKPLVVIPRKASLGEHRNEHQLATAAKFKELEYVHVAEDERELRIILDELLPKKTLKPLHQLKEHASEELLSSLAEFVN